jgi:hypothetical protein
MFILELCQALEKQKVNYAIVGGYAVALHGAVWGTVDINLVVQWEKDQLNKIEQSLQSLGLVSRLPIDSESLFEFRDEYINNRKLIAWHFYHPNDVPKQIDVIINYDLKKQPVVVKKSIHKA